MTGSEDSDRNTVTLEALADRFQSAWNSHDMDAFGALFASTATFVGRFGTVMRGKREIVSVHRRIHASSYADSRLDLGAPEIRRVSEDVAILLMPMRLTIPATGAEAMESAQPDEVNALAQIVALRRSGGWLIEGLANIEVTSAGVQR